MKNQALFSSKDKSKKSKHRLLQFLYGALRVVCPVGYALADRKWEANLSYDICKSKNLNLKFLILSIYLFTYLFSFYLIPPFTCFVL